MIMPWLKTAKHKLPGNGEESMFENILTKASIKVVPHDGQI